MHDVKRDTEALPDAHQIGLEVCRALHLDSNLRRPHYILCAPDFDTEIVLRSQHFSREQRVVSRKPHVICQQLPFHVAMVEVGIFLRELVLLKWNVCQDYDIPSLFMVSGGAV